MTASPTPSKSPTVGRRVEEHLRSHVRRFDGTSAPFALCQDGIADALGISRGHAAAEVNRLVRDGKATWCLAHVVRSNGKQGDARRRIYTPTQVASVERETSKRLCSLADYVFEAYGPSGCRHLKGILDQRMMRGPGRRNV
jgi:hypothetical protein